MANQPTSQLPGDKLDFKKILPVFIIVLVDLLGLTIIIPLLPLYAASHGANATVIGFLGATYPAMQVVGAPILGRLSDRFGRKPVLLISQIGTFLGFIVLGLANSLWVLFLARVIDGLSGANISTAQAVISDSTNAKTRTQGLGLIGAAFGLGFIIGPVIAFVSLAIGNNNYHIPAFVAASFSFVSIMLTAFWLKETHPADRTISLSSKREIGLKNFFTTLKKPLVGFLLVAIFIQQVAFGGFQQLLSLFTLSRLGLNASGNSVIFVFVGILIVSVQGYFIGRWSRKFGERWLIRFGLIMVAAGLLLTSFTPRIPPPWYSQKAVALELSGGRNMPGETPPTQNLQINIPPDTQKGWLGLGWILLAMIPAAIGGGVLQPSINSLLTRHVSPIEIGGTLGISAALLSAANALAPVIGGALFQSIGPSAPYWLGAILTGILLLFSIKGLKTTINPDS
jgi:DHA1 family tetracycline resistance protein-like MFS transporter